jgi:hypothetical protein
MSRHVGFDTETQRGRASLISDGTGRPLLFPKTFEGIADWLDAGPTRTYVAWNMDFDAQAILRYLPRGTLSRLAVTTRAECGPWRIRYVPSKYLMLTRGHRPSIRLHDLQQFLGGSLERAAQKHLGEGKTDLPVGLTEYLRRGAMGDALRSRWRSLTIEYCERDAALVTRLAAMLTDSCAAAGIDFARPTSPASVARRYWGKLRNGLTPRDDLDGAWASYRGGRIEVTRRGLIEGATHWDLHSAYPSVIARLIAPGACERIEVKGDAIPPDAEYGYALADFDFTEGRPTYPVGVDVGGITVYPSGRFRATVDVATARCVRDSGLGMKIVRGVYWLPMNDERPFASIADLYRERSRRPEASLAIKLVMNSTYGLLAERVRDWKSVAAGRSVEVTDRLADGDIFRSRRKHGSMTNPLMAAAITGRIRARLWSETRGRAFTYATDGCLLPRGAEPDGPIGPGLGEWAREGDCDAVVIGSGIYLLRYTEKWHAFHRGFRAPLHRLLTGQPNRSWLRFEELRAKSLAECYRDGERYRAMNDLRPDPRTLDLCFDSKRKWPGRMRAREFLSRSQGSEPHRYFGRMALRR